MRKRKIVGRIVKSVIALIVLAVVGYGVYSYVQMQNAILAASQMPNYTFREVARGDVDIGVKAKGKITSNTSTTVVLGWAGKVKEAPFEVGDIVEEGDVLAVVENDDLGSEIAAANNSLKQQEINLQKQIDALEQTIDAPASGRLKVIKAKIGEEASTTIGTWGYLVWVSPDGMMELTCETDYECEPEHLLDVRDSHGNIFEARVTSADGYMTTMEIHDDFELEPDEHVQVFRKGETLIFGEGDVTIKNGIKVTGSGKIKDILVANNQVVERGDSLFSIDTKDALLTYESQTISVADAQRKIADLRKDYGKSQLTAPVSGVITEFNLLQGQNAATGLTVARIQDIENLQTVIDVDELDIAKISLGQRVEITLEALEGKIYTGTVSKIAVIGNNTNNFATYPVTIDIDNPGEIKIGMSCEATIRIDSVRNVKILPVEMLQRNKDGYSVLLVTEGLDTHAAAEREQAEMSGEGGAGAASINEQMRQMEAAMMGGTINTPADALSMGVITESRPVEVGLINEDYAQIISGLEIGDWVAIERKASSIMDMMMMGGGARTVQMAPGGAPSGGPGN